MSCRTFALCRIKGFTHILIVNYQNIFLFFLKMATTNSNQKHYVGVFMIAPEICISRTNTSIRPRRKNQTILSKRLNAIRQNNGLAHESSALTLFY